MKVRKYLAIAAFVCVLGSILETQAQVVQTQLLGGCVLHFKSNGSLGQDLDHLDRLSTRLNGNPARFEVSSGLGQSGTLRLLAEWSGTFIHAPTGVTEADHAVTLSIDQVGEVILLSAAALHQAPRSLDVHMELKRRDAKALIPGRYRLPVTITCMAE